MPVFMKRFIGNPRISMHAVTLILLSGLFFALFANLAFFRNYVTVYGFHPSSLVHLVSLAIVLLALTLVVLSLLCWPAIQKPILTLLFLLAALAAYFMDTYNLAIDAAMIANVFYTDPREVRDLLTFRLLAYFLLLGVLPSCLVWLLRIRPERPLRAIGSRLVLAGVSIVVAVFLLLGSIPFYSSYLRENKTLRYFSNPLSPLHAIFVAVRPEAGFSNRVLQTLGLDAQVPESDIERELVVMVVGETARADRFSLNGYERNTNPELASLDVVSFSNVHSCGTSTVVSLPCMFSLQTRSEFEKSDFEQSENALDVLAHAGVKILWRDNNSSSKGVAVRVPEEDFRSAEINPDCDLECRDEGMLSGLQEFVDEQSEGDILIVLHQMGSHGPAYFRRYPQTFERFTPSCNTSMLDACSDVEIGNSYDNTILYTDHFLASVIKFLEANDDHFETAMFYVSDHGESLGESGIYLHGYPYALAPEEQTHVAMIMWFGRNYDDADPGLLRALRQTALSHDNIFHTLLGLFEIESELYQPSQDVLRLSRPTPAHADPAP